MRHGLWIALLLLTSCAQQGWTRVPAGAPKYDATTEREVKVLATVPPGAVLLGEVHGRSSMGMSLGSAKRRAASLGANALVVTATGTERDASGIASFDFTEAQALYVER